MTPFSKPEPPIRIHGQNGETREKPARKCAEARSRSSSCSFDV